MQAGSSQTLPLSPRPSEASDDPLLYSTALELCNRGQDVQLQPPGWCGGVDTLAKGDECDAEGLEFIEQQNQVPEVAPEPVQAPAHTRTSKRLRRGPKVA